MLRVLFALPLLILSAALRLSAEAQSTAKAEKQRTATVSGQVTLNGEPLGGVMIRFFPEYMLASGDPRSPHQVVTDEQGRYRVTGIVAGNYQVNILSTEYLLITGGLQSDLRSRTLSVSEGEKVEGFDLVLKRGGVITGRVTDSNGLPLVRQGIELIKVGDDGKPQPRPFNHPAVKITDEQGVYRITGLPDGRYLVSAGMTSAVRNGSPLSRDVYYPQTFHPNVSDPSKARVVEVSDDAEITGIDIFIAEAMKTFDVKGRVVRAETGEPAEGIEIFYGLHREGAGGIGPRSRGARSNSDGEFLLQGLMPGKYAIYTELGGEREYFAEPVICEITDGGIDGVEVKLQQGSSISGTVVIEGMKDPDVLAKLSKVGIGSYSKTPQPVTSPRETARINANGSFRIAGLRPGRIHIYMSRGPNTLSFSIKRIEQNGTLLQDGIEIGPGEHLSKVRVIISYGALTLRGAVNIIGGSLPPHLGMLVNLNSTNESESGPPLVTKVDARGQFIFQNLVPGEYEVRLVGLNHQPGEHTDKAISKLIYNTRQKVTISNDRQPIVTLVVDLGQKEGNQ